MLRRVWIIRSDAEAIKAKYEKKGIKKHWAAYQQELKESQLSAVNDARADAIANSCSEIAWGIPPVLKNKVSLEDLPMAFIEPESAPAPIPRNFAEEIDAIMTRLEAVEKK